jgi:hypothetical protein
MFWAATKVVGDEGERGGGTRKRRHEWGRVRGEGEKGVGEHMCK